MCPLVHGEHTGWVFFWLVEMMVLLACLHSLTVVHFFECALVACTYLGPPQGMQGLSWDALVVGIGDVVAVSFCP